MPLRPLPAFQCVPGLTGSMVIPVPAGPCAFHLEISHMPPEGLFAILGSGEFAWPTEMGLATTHLGLSVLLDAGGFPEQVPTLLTIWYMDRAEGGVA